MLPKKHVKRGYPINFITIGISFLAGIALSSFIEFGIHKYLLHGTPKSLRKISYVKSMFQGHVVSHHANYMPDDHYTRDDTNKGEVLTFSWYEGILIVSVSTALVFGLAAAARVMLDMPVAILMPEVIGFSVALVSYYAAYEWLHAVMHVPDKWRWVCSTRIMKMLNRHHYQHHLEPDTNLNVIFPLADYVFGTKRRLSKEKYIYADSFSY